MLALGDALALEVSHSRGFAAEDFCPTARLADCLDAACSLVGDLMHSGEGSASCRSSYTDGFQVIHEMSRQKAWDDDRSWRRKLPY